MRLLKPRSLFVPESSGTAIHEHYGHEMVTCASCGTEMTRDRAVRIGVGVERHGDEWTVDDTALFCPYCADVVTGYADPPSGRLRAVWRWVRWMWNHPGETTYRLTLILAMVMVVLLPLLIIGMELF